jgi:biopolymer transport protein ExbD
MRFLHKKRARTPAVIIVSLIDVLLVVLIFLMVTTTAKQIEPTLKLNLPDSKEAKPGESSNKDKPFTILVATNFPYFFIGERGDRATTLDKLQAELTDAVKKDPNLKVAVRADKMAPFGEIVKLIDATKVAHVGSLNFITEKQARP